ncbi:hypothetical protein FBU59_004285, partial [Linderina macrospora]
MNSLTAQYSARLLRPAFLPRSLSSRSFHASDHRLSGYKNSKPDLESLRGETQGVDPEVSSYAIGATVFFIGGLSYYLYSEYGHVASRYLPWSAAPPAKIEPTAEIKEAKRMNRLRNRLVPKSTMPATEQVNWTWTHPGLYVTGSNVHGLVDPMHPGSG